MVTAGLMCPPLMDPLMYAPRATPIAHPGREGGRHHRRSSAGASLCQTLPPLSNRRPALTKSTREVVSRSVQLRLELRAGAKEDDHARAEHLGKVLAVGGAEALEPVGHGEVGHGLAVHVIGHGGLVCGREEGVMFTDGEEGRWKVAT